MALNLASFRWICIPVFVLLIYGCGAATNPLGYLQPPGYQKSHEYLLNRAKFYLDLGENEKALEFAEKAQKLDDGHEEGALVLGFTYLSLAGISSFDLAAKLREEGGGDAADKDGAASLLETDANPLDPLKSLLGLDDTQLTQLTVAGNKVTFEDGAVIEGAPASGIFADYPVLLPKTAIAARQNQDDVIAKLAKAVKVVCPFVAEGAKILSPVEDPRHSDSACPATNKRTEFGGRIHFLWALAHLTEAIAFNNVVLYDPNGDGANLVKRSTALSAATDLGVVEYLAAVQDLALVTEQILTTDPEKSKNSMLIGMVNDLEATNKGFLQLPGMPASLTKSISESIAQINTKRETLKSSGTGLNHEAAGSQALKEKLTSGLTTNLKAQYEAKTAAGELSDTEKVQFCQSFQQISSESLEGC